MGKRKKGRNKGGNNKPEKKQFQNNPKDADVKSGIPIKEINEKYEAVVKDKSDTDKQELRSIGEAEITDIDKNSAALKEAWGKVSILFGAAKKEEEKNDKLSTDLNKTEENIKKTKTELQSKKSEYDEKQKKLLEWENELEEKAKSLSLKEDDALAGFRETKKQVEGELENRIKKAHEELTKSESDVFRALKDRKESFEKVAEEFKVHLDKVLKDMTHNMNVESNNQLTELKNTNIKEALKNKEDNLTEFISERAQKLCEAAKDDLNQQIEQLKKINEDRNIGIIRLKEELNALHQNIGLGNSKEILNRINEYPKVIDRNEYLEAELKKKATDKDKIKIKEQAGEITDLRTKLALLVSKEQDIEKLKLERSNMEFENDCLKKSKECLAAQQKAFEDEYEKLSRKYEGLQKNGELDKIFVECYEMDQENTFNTPAKLENTKVTKNTAKELVTFLKNKIFTKAKLRYEDATLRCFLAGLNMSKFTILQGFCGTGKTSLPIAFIEAVSSPKNRNGEYIWNYEVVEVQAGWRDRSDIIGYYNTFENKYYESKMLKALYRASLPGFQDYPFFIVLDEMNLSHPEQYFADFLSLLERKKSEGDPLLDLISSTRAKSLPKLITDDGKIKIPDNVWFIGTANQDATTMGFAPKTLDRANVIDMKRPSSESEKNWNDEKNSNTLHYKTLIEMFQKAKTDFADEVKNGKKIFANEDFKNLMAGYEVGWGWRPEAQIAEYLPIICAAGGNTIEAVDHILKSKILCQLTNRYEMNADKLEEFIKQFEVIFDEIYGDGEAQSTSSYKLLFNEFEQKSR